MLNRFLDGQNTSAQWMHLKAPLATNITHPILARIEYKILTITHKCIRRQEPQYLKDLITVNKPKHDNWRSNNKGTTLALPKVKHEPLLLTHLSTLAPLL